MTILTWSVMAKRSSKSQPYKKNSLQWLSMYGEARRNVVHHCWASFADFRHLSGAAADMAKHHHAPVRYWQQQRSTTLSLRWMPSVRWQRMSAVLVRQTCHAVLRVQRRKTWSVATMSFFPVRPHTGRQFQSGKGQALNWSAIVNTIFIIIFISDFDVYVH